MPRGTNHSTQEATSDVSREQKAQVGLRKALATTRQTGLRRRWRRFESCRGHHVMSQDIGIRPNLRVRPFCCSESSAGLVVAGGVEGEFAQELAGGGVDDADVAVEDEQQDVGSGVGSSEVFHSLAKQSCPLVRGGALSPELRGPYVGNPSARRPDDLAGIPHLGDRRLRVSTVGDRRMRVFTAVGPAVTALQRRSPATGSPQTAITATAAAVSRRAR